MLRRIQYLAPLLLLPVLAHAQTSSSYTQSNLISDGSVKAQQTDPNLINPWVIAIGQQTPFWINTAGTGLSEVYDSGPNKQFIVTIPSAANGKSGSPTGIAFNSSATDFVLKQGGAATFIFDSLDGTISAWNANLANAQTVVSGSMTGATYTGLSIINNGLSSVILAADLLAARSMSSIRSSPLPISTVGLSIPQSLRGTRLSMSTCLTIRSMSCTPYRHRAAVPQLLDQVRAMSAYSTPTATSSNGPSHQET